MTFNQLDAIRCTARMSYGLGGQDLINTFALELVSPPSLTNAQALVDVGEFCEVLYTNIVAQLGTAIHFIDITLQNLTADAAPLVIGWPTLTVGTNPADLSPPQVTALIVARTAKSRKSGRFNIPGLVENGITNGTFTGAMLTALTNFAAALLVTQIRTNGNWRYNVRTRNVIPPPTVINSYDAPVSAALIIPARTQRRRSIGFGS